MSDVKVPRALLAEDDPSTSRGVQALLRIMGVEAVQVFNSQDALIQIQGSEFALLLVDLNLEEVGSGFKVVEVARKTLGPDVPILVMSGRSDQHAIAHSLELGADDFLMKPVDRNLFEKKILRFLKSNEQQSTSDPRVQLPPSKFTGEFGLELKVREIDEFGVVIASGHVFSKGGLYYLEGEWIKEVTHSLDPVRTTATSSWYDPDEKSYFVFLEFDPTDESIAIAVRNWIIRHHQYG